MLLRSAILASLLAADPLSSPPESDVDCGSRCLYIALRGLGFAPADLDEVKSRLGPPPVDGYTFGQLEAAARSYGAHTLGVETTPENLARRAPPFACIAHLTHDHFVLITHVTADSAILIDPPQKTTIPLDTLSALWDRRALLIARQPLLREEDVSPSTWQPFGTIASALCIAAAALIAWRWSRSRSVNRVS